MSATIWNPGGTSGALTSKLVKEIALTDMTTVLIASILVAYFRVYAPFRTLALYASLSSVSTSGVVTVDVNVNGTSILATKLTIDANEKNSVDAAIPYVFVGSPAPAFHDFDVGSEVTFDIDTGGTGAKALVAYFLGFDL